MVGNFSQKPMHEKVCLDESTEKLMYQMGSNMNKQLCSKTDIHSTGSQYTVDTVCKFGNSTRTGHSVATFSGDTAYHTEITSHAEPAVAGHTDSKSTLDGKWVGACPADMKPGDMLVTIEGAAQPMRMNLNDMGGK
jgi:hypothetical protein